jgi:hypothetical protein
MPRTALACVAALSLAACAPTLTRHVPPGDDPSNPDAPESTTRPASRTLDARAPLPTAPEPAAATTTYTCPMHPEVVSDHPGRCPKCGMALVPQEKEKKP